MTGNGSSSMLSQRATCSEGSDGEVERGGEGEEQESFWAGAGQELERRGGVVPEHSNLGHILTVLPLPYSP